MHAHGGVVCRSKPIRCAPTLTVLSAEAVAISLPSGLRTTLYTVLVCAFTVFCRLPFMISHTRMVSSWLHVMIFWLSFETHTP